MPTRRQLGTVVVLALGLLLGVKPLLGLPAKSAERGCVAIACGAFRDGPPACEESGHCVGVGVAHCPYDTTPMPERKALSLLR